MRILIVEDNRMTRRMLERYLQELGYDVLQASDGQTALDLHRRHRVPFVDLALVIGAACWLGQQWETVNAQHPTPNVQ